MRPRVTTSPSRPNHRLHQTQADSTARDYTRTVDLIKVRTRGENEHLVQHRPDVGAAVEPIQRSQLAGTDIERCQPRRMPSLVVETSTRHPETIRPSIRPIIPVQRAFRRHEPACGHLIDESPKLVRPLVLGTIVASSAWTSHLRPPPDFCVVGPSKRPNTPGVPGAFSLDSDNHLRTINPVTDMLELVPVRNFFVIHSTHIHL